MKILIGTNPTTGLQVFREFGGEFKPSRKKEKVITVWYEEWQELPNGTAVFQTEKKYHVKDKEAVLDEQGNEITPATTRYTDWCVGKPNAGLPVEECKTLEQIFDDAVNSALAMLPIDFPDGGII